MHVTIKNLLNIKSKVKQKVKDKNSDQIPQIIAVSKTFKLNHINPLIEYGHIHFGENKVQEAMDKWLEIKKQNQKIKLHLVGKLQTNKVKFALEIFDYIHSLDNEKLAKKISSLQVEKNKNLKLFIQVNIGNEEQKSGISERSIPDFYNYCIDLKLNIIGLMCIPPINQDARLYFEKMKNLKRKLNIKDLSMGMSSDYLEATEYEASYIRIGSNIFGKRD